MPRPSLRSCDPTTTQWSLTSGSVRTASVRTLMPSWWRMAATRSGGRCVRSLHARTSRWMMPSSSVAVCTQSGSLSPPVAVSAVSVVSANSANSVRRVASAGA